MSGWILKRAALLTVALSLVLQGCNWEEMFFRRLS